MKDPEWWKKPILRHCPADCMDSKTCHKGVELPVNKNVCYNPPNELSPDPIYGEMGYFDDQFIGCPHCGSKTKHKSWCPDQQIINAFKDLKSIDSDIKRESIS